MSSVLPRVPRCLGAAGASAASMRSGDRCSMASHKVSLFKPQFLLYKVVSQFFPRAEQHALGLADAPAKAQCHRLHTVGVPVAAEKGGARLRPLGAEEGGDGLPQGFCLAGPATVCLSGRASDSSSRRASTAAFSRRLRRAPFRTMVPSHALKWVGRAGGMAFHTARYASLTHSSASASFCKMFRAMARQ